MSGVEVKILDPVLKKQGIKGGGGENLATGQTNLKQVLKNGWH